MQFIDYYKILGLNKTATAQEIKSTYRKLARKYHPDLNPNDKEAKRKFQEINEANEVLSDPEKRKKYDQYGKDWEHAEEFEKSRQYQSQSQSQSSQRQRTGHAETFEGGFSEFFDSFFGGKTSADSRQVKFRGEDYSAELEINLRDAYKSHRQTLTVNGKNIRITVPAGIANGQTIKIAHYGGPGINGGPNGDLYITFSIRNDPDFKRLGIDLFTSVDIDFFTAVLGGDITIETLTGKVKLKVKAGTQNGSKVKLKGKGFPVYKHEDSYGDLYITYNILIPTNLTEKQKKLFTELSKL